MTPEREKLIRGTWAAERRGILELLERNSSAQIIPRLKLPRIPTDFSVPPPQTAGFETITFTKKVRTVTWAVECEGLELGTYRL